VHSPKVALINLGDVDAAGHGGSWNAYTRTIEYADSLVYYLWTRVQQFPEYRDRTAFIVTSDHGRHYDAYGDWRNHGDTCPGCRRIPLIAVGPDFKVGTTSWTPCQQVDICKTVGYLLGFPTPKAGGRILNEILQVPAGVVEFLPPRNRSVIVRDGAVQILNAWDTMGTIGLFDLTGRLLYGAEMHPGGSISWQPPAAGVMFYRFRSGENSEKGKLTFIR
jgi:hypothetical protein